MRRALRVLWVLAGLAALGVALAATLLILAHRDIDGLDPALPDAASLTATGLHDLPVRLHWIDTARQAMPRAAVLDSELDPTPSAPYVMAHVAFVLAWADGRLLLVDLGMDRESAPGFGRPLELVAGAEPLVALGSAAEQLGEAVERVEGVAFTHLHTDHTDGGASLCAARETTRPIPVFQAPLQAERSNFTTRPGRARIEEAGCLEPRRLEGESPFGVPGFPGVVVIPVAGHTPGSQVFVVHLRGEEDGTTRSFLLSGDVVNQLDGLRLDLPKPRLYSLLVVPEATERLARVRRYLRGLVEHGMTPLVSHDLGQLEASGVPAWSP